MPTGEFRAFRLQAGGNDLPYDPGGTPLQLTSFVGREREVETIAGLMRTTRLLTLTGVGGAGKTRLAIEAATRHEIGTLHTSWVDLAPLTDPTLVPHVVAVALGFREEAGRSALEILSARLCEQPRLIILDNCEHLVEASGELASRLLRSCPDVRILATSREALGISGEQAWLVPPLSLPGADGSVAEVGSSEAVQLFLDRARAVAPTFALDDRNAAAVAKICRRLDGIPLAIELAAARVRVLAPEQIAARLEESFKVLGAPGRTTITRHRTLHEAIDWSHALLTTEEAALFRRLAVFAGSFALDGVEEVCPAAPVSGSDVLDLLSQLVDKSMVVMEMAGDQARYRLLETLRAYGLEKLQAAGEEATFRDRHSRFFVALVAAAEQPIFGGGRTPVWTDRLVAEDANLRAAVDRVERAPDGAESALVMAAGLHWHWFSQGQFREGRRQLAAALARRGEASQLNQGKALAAAAAMAFWLGEIAEITPLGREAIGVLRQEDDTWSLSYALTTTGYGVSLADPLEGSAMLSDAVTLARSHGTTILLSFALYWKGREALHRGDLETARSALTESRTVGQAVGHGPATAHPQTILGLLELTAGAHATAAAHLRESLDLHVANEDILGCLWTLEGMVRLAAQIGNSPQATRLLTFSQIERARVGAPWSPPEQDEFAAVRASLESSLDPEAFAAAREEAERWTLAEAIASAVAGASLGAQDHSERLPAAAVVASATPARGSRRTLSVRSLGELRIAVDGVPLDRGAWQSARSRELLLYLLCHPAGRNRGQVGVAFWPEASSEQVRNNFHVTLHRLRKSLGDQRWIVLEGDRYRVDPAAEVAFDALQFERELRLALPSIDHAPNLDALEAILARYAGDFLEQESAGDWHLETRERLRHLHLEALAAMGSRWISEQRWREAVGVFRRIITRDPMHEGAYRELMRCHARLNERSEAIRAYERLSQTLLREFEAEPDQQTRRLYARIMASESV